MNLTNLFISIVIPTYNRKESLKKCLKYIEKIDYPKNNFEVIIIDDGSNDGTEKMIREFIKKTLLKIEYFKQKNSGPARARNEGIKKSRGEIIFFVDDDVLVPKNFIKKSLDLYKNKKIGGVGGNVLPKKLSWPDLYYIARYLDEFNKNIKLKNSETEKGISTALCSYRKKAIEEVGGFDESFPLAAGEDIDLTKRVLKNGWIIIKDKSILGIHLRSETFLSVLKLKFKRMSGAVINDKKSNKDIKIYQISRVVNQWKNFKSAKKEILKKDVSILDLIKFIYLTGALAIVSIIGSFYYKLKLIKK